MIHCRSAAEKLRLDWIDGSATLTMLRSRMTMNCATQQTTRIQPRRVPPRLSAAALSATAGAAGVSTLTSVSAKDPPQTHETPYRTPPWAAPAHILRPPQPKEPN